MKTYYFTRVKTFVFTVLLFACSSAISQTVIADHGFGTDQEGWTVYGTYSGRNFNANSCTAQGALFTYYDFDFDARASVLSPTYDLTSYTQVDISFCHINSTNQENGDGFDLQYFNGTNWTTIRSYRRGIDFFGGGIGNATNLTASINTGTYTFAANSAFRFVGQNNITNEWNVYDDILITTPGTCAPISSFPYNQGFENGLGGWTQDTGDDNDWTRNNGGTPSNNTGPIAAQEGAWYMFTEASFPNFNNEFNLVSPCIDLTTTDNAELSFYYHMYGNNMGRLDVEISTDGGATYGAPIWFQNGEDQASSNAAWTLVNLDLSSYFGQTIRIRYSGLTGVDFTSDMAIDDISITVPAQPDPEHTVYFNTFDDSNEGWTNITSTNDSWTRTNSFTTTDEMGEGSFFRNTNYNSYNNNTNIVIQSPVYDFTNINNLKLSLDIKYNTENSLDGMRILYSVSGGAFTVLGAVGEGSNWYNGNVSALGGQGWSDDGHVADPAFTPHSQFGNSSITLPNGIFANQSNVRFRVQFASNGSNSLEGVAFDNFKIEGDPTTPLNDSSVGPANLTSNLRLWLKANSGISNSDNTPLTFWQDQAFETTLDQENAFASTTTAPTYRDSGERNINFNPIADFDNTANNYLSGKGGLYSQDLFIVFRSDDTIDTQTGTFNPGRQFAIGARFAEDSYHEDATGIAAGSSTARYTDEVLAFNISSFPNEATAGPNDTSYGRAYSSTTDTFSNHPLIVNVKSNLTGTASEIYKNGKRVDNVTGLAGNGLDLNFNELNNVAFLLGTGRSGINGRTTSQMNGMVAEVISYSSPNSAINQQKIESYLALKYGVTLQDNASALLDHRLNDTNYIDSAGTILWNTTDTDGSGNSYNYDVAGIGRDDASNLDQRQSRSQNDEADGVGPTSGFLTMGLTDVYDTNNQNIASTSPITDRNFIMWGNNNASLDAAPSTISVNMSANIAGLNTDVSFIGMQRIWRVKETGDVGRIKVSIPQSVVRNITPPGNYLMFISETGVFTPTAQYRVMSSDGNGNLEAEYDFPASSVRYITFGYAPEIVVERSVNFVPAAGNYIDVEDHLDLNSTFTLSTWIKRESGSANTSIISKRDLTFTEGYDLKINLLGRVEMTWINGGLRTIQSAVAIPQDIWHHIAVTHDGTTARLYIDGVLETTANLPLTTDTNRSFLIGAAGRDGSTNSHFDGNIDEVRVWNAALTENQIRFLMNQELEDNPSTIGKYFDNNSILPTKNDAAGLDFSNLRAYFPMSRYTYTNTNDDSGNNLTGYLRQLRTVDFQTAPLPYVSTQNGDWTANSTWTDGALQYIPGSRSLADNDIYVDWNIVETSHDITIDNTTLFDDDLANVDDIDGNDNEGNRTVLAHIQNSGTITIDGDNSTDTGFGYTVTHYLEMSGKFDLEGESQLIQTTDSDLILGPSGELEKDQQGVTSTYHYNYWSSPVGETSIAPASLNPNRHSYAVTDIMRDGTNAVNFTSTGYDGSDTTPITIADYWIWKFANNPDGDYSAWEHVRRTGNIEPGEGFTMKGPGSTGTEQNYTFLGKPNNADINLTISQYNDYLVGNPYASAIDARQFIIDNGPTLFYDDSVTPEDDATTSGTLYFWEHWGGGDHILANYQGGYGTYNLSGSIAAPFSMAGTSDPDVSQTGSGTKAPGRYIPVGQGFFVVAANGGTINFNNGQRIFKKESATNGEFFRASETNDASSNETVDEADTRHKLKLGFDSVGGQHRQLLLTIDENTTTGVDWGYDGTTYEYKNDDMFWGIENNFYVIQGANEMDENASYPLIVYTSEDGTNTIKIDELVNFESDENVYLHDIELDYYHDLKEGDYEIFLNAGYYDSRFAIVFANQNQSLSTDDEILNEEQLDVRYANNIDKVVLINPHGLDVKTIQVFNILGQEIVTLDNIESGNYTEYNVGTLSSGPYIIKLNTVSGSVSKKVLVN